MYLFTKCSKSLILLICGPKQFFVYFSVSYTKLYLSLFIFRAFMYRRPKSSGTAGAAFKPPRMIIPQKPIPKPVQRIEGDTNTIKAPKRPVPLQTKTNLPSPSKKQKVEETNYEIKDDESLRYFEVVWRKKTMKKNKIWDGDGIIILSQSSVSLRQDESENFKEKFKSSNVQKFTTDGVFNLGSVEIEVMEEINDPNYIQKIKGSRKPTEPISKTNIKTAPNMKPIPTLRKPVILNTQFKKVSPINEPQLKAKKGDALYDSSAPDAIVMKKKSSNEVDVVIDPFLAKSLRSHQIKGVKFLYECVMGLRDFDGNGALLADDMGLGKTLQTITLIWTLLKQSPNGFDSPIASKVLIACPVTLVGNWKKEFKKWLPLNRLGILTLHPKSTGLKDKQDVNNFANTRVYQVLIMGYEKILNMKEELKKTQFDLLICDEGHRLKNNSNKTLHALNSLDIEKKVLLSGTPIQNDLNEFFNIVDFVNPGVLGSINSFKRNYINPILKARELNCVSPEITSKGDEKSQDLIDLTKPFILRRTSSIIQNHLPPKTDIVLFCPPTQQQVNLFNQILTSNKFCSLVNSNSGSSSGSLALITMLKKICNSPSLAKSDKIFQEINESNFLTQQISGKILVLIELLNQISKINEKIVIVSNYTQTLDILQQILQKLNLTYLRLDGSTPNKDRDSIVNQFNNSQPRARFAFLLSAKSGGIGLNLIGASRLILFDNDWNPSVDLQAMARIHRDGQKKPVFIYRLVTTGCIDEKIFQRQLMKTSLSDKFLDNKNGSNDDVFDMNDLKDLFTLNLNTLSNTHDLIECDCSGVGEDLDSDDEEESNAENKAKIEPEEKPKSCWISALDLKENEADIDKKKKTIKNCLIDFKHIDPSKIKEIELSIDKVTENIISQKPSLISYILTKVNKPAL